MAMTAQAAPPADLIAQIHFAGAKQISADTNSQAFTNIFCSVEARELEGQTLDKLSHFPGTWFKPRIAAGAGDEAKRFRPLLDDLLKAEWIWEVHATTSGVPETLLAVRLGADRAQLWQNDLAGILQTWTRLPVTKTGNGWLLKKDQPPNRVRFARVGDWVVLSWGQNELPFSDGVIRRLQAEKRPVPAAKDYWVAADVDWPRLASWFAPLKNFDFPKIEMQIAGRNGDLWANGKFILSRPLPPPERWRMPTNTIHQPLESFTAVRGIGPWLSRQSWVKRYEIQPPPDQLYIWALPPIPMRTFAAAPMPEASAVVAQLNTRLSPVFTGNTRSGFLSPVVTVFTNNEIAWRSVPFASPFLRALREPAGSFLFGGFFPNSERSQPLPRELFEQLNTPGLVYYHWEITSERLGSLSALTQLMLMITWHKPLGENSIASKWLNRIKPALGPTVTEVTRTGPNELTFLRKASCGLTAFELIALANWLEAADFPGCDLRVPPRAIRREHFLPGAPAAPVRPAPAKPTAPR